MGWAETIEFNFRPIFEHYRSIYHIYDKCRPYLFLKFSYEYGQYGASGRTMFLIFLFAVTAIAARRSSMAAETPGFFILGDSSVSCGETTFFSLLPENFSHVLCEGGSGPRHLLLSDLLGTSEKNSVRI